MQNASFPQVPQVPTIPFKTGSNSGEAWADNFNGGTGYLEDRAGWSSVTYTAGTGESGDDLLALVNNRVEQSANPVSGNGEIYNLATYSPVSTNYYVQCNLWTTYDNSLGVSVIVRGSRDGLNRLIGYTATPDMANDEVLLRRYINGTPADLDSYAVVGGIPETSQTIKLSAVGTGATVSLSVWWGGSLVIEYDDTNANRIVSTGLAGIVSCVDPVPAEKAYFDTFSIGY